MTPPRGMTRESLLGVVRELMAAVGGAMVAWGVQSEPWWPEVSGVLVAVVSLVWGIRANEGVEAVLTLVRKAISAAGGAAVATGVMTPEKAAAAVGVFGALVSVLWTLKKGAGVDGMLRMLLIGGVLGMLALHGAGCAGVDVEAELRDDETGAAAGVGGGRWRVGVPVDGGRVSGWAEVGGKLPAVDGGSAK